MERLGGSWKWRCEVFRFGLTWSSVSQRLGGETEVGTSQAFPGIKCKNSLHKRPPPKPFLKLEMEGRIALEPVVRVAPGLIFYIICRKEPCMGLRAPTRGNAPCYQPIFISHINHLLGVKVSGSKEPRNYNPPTHRKRAQSDSAAAVPFIAQTT